MKRILSIIFACTLLSGLTACDRFSFKQFDSTIKVGLICLHDENSTYDLNFIEGMKEAQKSLGLSDNQVIIKTNVPESNECYLVAANLAKQGCDIVFANSFGHEAYMAQAAKDFKNVQFCHASGTMAHTKKMDNFHDAFASIYEGRYLAGVAAGIKLNEMIDNGKITADEAVIGYVGAYTYAEVISGYTAFFLGARSICPSATMKVQFTGSWYDETAENNAAFSLINQNCVLISQHADSVGAPTACENAGVPNVSYNGSTQDICPNTFLISSSINWAPYYEYAIKAVEAKKPIDCDWTGNLTTASIVLSDVNKNAPQTTQDTLNHTAEELKNGNIHVFDTSKFTVGGLTITSYLADVDTDEANTPDTEVIQDGYFHESEFRSAPYFDLRIDGIETLNEKF